MHLSSAGMSRPIRPRMSPTCVQTPHTVTTTTDAFRACAGPFWRPKSPHFAGRQALLPLPLAGWRSDDLRDPLGECRRDANSLAPNGPKARTLRCARQELVRVPESNTKYGGLRGITGGKPSPVVEPSISESSGIPNRKNLHPVTQVPFIPLFTGQLYFWALGLRQPDSRNATEGEGSHARRGGGRARESAPR